MSTTPFPNILAFVEGTMERMFLNNNFHYVIVVPIHNGNSVPIDRICEKISSFYTTKNANPDMIIVWMDREKRPETSHAIRKKVVAALEEAGAPTDRIWAGVADQMTENWILADNELIDEFFPESDFSYEHESKNGKHILDELYRARGENYKETKHGPGLLKKMRIRRAAANSESAAAFAEGWKHECWWTDDSP